MRVTRIFIASALLIVIMSVVYLKADFISGNRVLLLISAILFSVVLLLELVIYVKYVLKPVRQIKKTIDFISGEDIGFLIGYTPKNTNNIDEQLIGSISESLRKVLNLGSTAEIIKKQTELAALQSQINPHFLYNTLDSIRGQATMLGVDEIAEMVEALSNFFRYGISTKGDLVTLEDELKNVGNYFKIQQYRFKNKFELIVEYDEKDNILEYVLPKLTIQPIIENSIYHGFRDRLGECRIVLRITATEKRLIIEISDNGTGIDKEVVSVLNDSFRRNANQVPSSDSLRHHGIALTNVNQRIRLFFGDQYGLTVSSIPNVGTDVEIVIPLKKEEDIVRLENMHETGNPQDGAYI
jgi:two-component system sensor histidine kinase YesM